MLKDMAAILAYMENVICRPAAATHNFFCRHCPFFALRAFYHWRNNSGFHRILDNGVLCSACGGD
jgi:hypothetical protein